jgi:dTDP-D-glucose 4,6-dehydratase
MDEQRIMQAIEDSIVSTIRKGEIFQIGYAERIDIMPIVKTIFEKLNMKRIESLIIAQMEEVVAEKVVNKYVTEMGTDMKKFFENATIREDIRFYMRKNIEKMLDTIREKDLEANSYE